MHKETSLAYEHMLKKYSAWQTADLYAHFSPVGLINHKLLLSDFTEYGDDTVGTIESVWDRIKKSGEDMFYRVEYDPNPKKVVKMPVGKKRAKEKEEIQGKLKSRLINTSIVDTPYIKNVIKAYVDGDTGIEDKQLYKEQKKAKKMKVSNLFWIAMCINTSCNMKSNRENYQELHVHKGGDNYEVSAIIQKQNEASYMHFDTMNSVIIVDSYYNALIEKDRIYTSLKVDFQGQVIDDYEINGVLKDGTMKGYDYYSNWIISGDKTKHLFINPLTEEEQKNPDIWLLKFKELYESATYIYETSWNYYFKVDGLWYEIKYNLEVVNDDFVLNHPPRQDQDVRIMKLRDLSSDFFKSRAKRDTSFVDIVGYEETDSEKGSGLNPISYSAGDYYLNLYMPLGDTIKIKRHGSMGVNMQFYKIPVTQGGRNDVVFIVQEPNELYPDREFGGMYVVRPRDIEQKQYGTHESSADSYASQYDSIKGGIDTEAKFLKPMGD